MSVTREPASLFKQDSATHHTANRFERYVESVFGENDQLGEQPLRLADLNPCGFYLWVACYRINYIVKFFAVGTV